MYIEGNYLNIVRAIYEKPIGKIILSGEKLKKIPSKIRNTTRVSTLTTTIQHGFGSHSYRNYRRKRNKKHPDQKK